MNISYRTYYNDSTTECPNGKHEPFYIRTNNGKEYFNNGRTTPVYVGSKECQECKCFESDKHNVVVCAFKEGRKCT